MGRSQLPADGEGQKELWKTELKDRQLFLRVFVIGQL
jgi:hypothetical protein